MAEPFGSLVVYENLGCMRLITVFSNNITGPVPSVDFSSLVPCRYVPLSCYLHNAARKLALENHAATMARCSARGGRNDFPFDSCCRQGRQRPMKWRMGN
jgi:hypothetical protein